MIVVAFYTSGSSYEREAELLVASLDRVGLEHHVQPVMLGGDWYTATAYKASFLRWARSRFRGSLLYVDVDAFVHEDCSAYFDGLDADFGAHWFAGPAKGWDRSDVCSCLFEGHECSRPHRMLSGTLFLGDTRGCRRLLDAWVDLNTSETLQGRREGGGQKNLWRVLQDLGEDLHTVELPGRYCYVFDKPWAYPFGERPVIEHTIASRENRGRSTHNWARRARIAELMGLVAA